jgi:hypothetical protein
VASVDVVTPKEVFGLWRMAVVLENGHEHINILVDVVDNGMVSGENKFS